MDEIFTTVDEEGEKRSETTTMEEYLNTLTQLEDI